RVAGVAPATTEGGALRVRRTRAGAARARLGEVADPGGGAARRPAADDHVGRAGVGRPVAALGDVADVDGGTADGGALRVRRTDGRRPVAGLVQVAGPGRGPADRARRREDVRRAIVANPVARLDAVAGERGRAAYRRALLVRWAGRVRPVARFRGVADAGGGATRSTRRLDGVGRTRVGGAVAALGDVADVRRRAAHCRALRVRRAHVRAAVARLVEIAGSRGGAADRPRRLELVGGAVVGHAVAALVGVAAPGARPADGGALRVGRTRGAHSVAALGLIADARHGAALGARRDDLTARVAAPAAVAGLRVVGHAVAADALAHHLDALDRRVFGAVVLELDLETVAVRHGGDRRAHDRDFAAARRRDLVEVVELRGDGALDRDAEDARADGRRLRVRVHEEQVHDVRPIRDVEAVLHLGRRQVVVVLALEDLLGLHVGAAEDAGRIDRTAAAEVAAGGASGVRVEVRVPDEAAAVGPRARAWRRP